MKNWQIPGLLTILIIGFLLISGCTQDNDKYCRENFPGTAYDPSSKMCEKIVTQIPNSKVTQDPIIGVWRYYNSSNSFDARYRINANGTFISSFSMNNLNTLVISGTWIAKSNNEYQFRNTEGKYKTLFYDPARGVFDSQSDIPYVRYNGDVAAASSIIKTTPSTVAPTIDPNTVLTAGQYQLSNMRYYIEGSNGYLSGTIKNTGTTYTNYIGLTGTLYDANNAVLVESIDVIIGLAPGETGKFHIMFSGPGARMPFTRYFIKVDGWNFR